MFDYFLSYRNFNELVHNVNVSLFCYVLNNINIYIYIYVQSKYHCFLLKKFEVELNRKFLHIFNIILIITNKKYILVNKFLKFK